MSEILAWRQWRLDVPQWHVPVHEGLPTLMSLVMDNWPWMGPVCEANNGPVEAKNTNGLWALKAPKLADDVAVHGMVALSGRIVEAADGYRGQRATIRSLALGPAVWLVTTPEDRTMLIKGLEERYQCDVDGAEQACREFIRKMRAPKGLLGGGGSAGGISLGHVTIGNPFTSSPYVNITGPEEKSWKVIAKE